jgi:hypothetical protein
MNQPIPILDEKEKRLVKTLTIEYEKFVTPGPIARTTNEIQAYLSDKVPDIIKDTFNDSLKTMSEADLIKKAIEVSGKGFSKMQDLLANMTLNKSSIIGSLKIYNKEISFESICQLRSYDIEKLLNKQKKIDVGVGFSIGASTGFFGFPAIPFSLALGMLLYFRIVQNIALHYGYDVKDDPREMEIASAITMGCLAPNPKTQQEDLMALLGKMMLTTNLSSLKNSLARKLTYEQMAKEGGSQLFFVKVRALGHKSAQKALQKAGEKGIENQLLKKMLEQVAPYLSKEVGKKSIPILGAFIGGLFDFFITEKVFRGANIMYHKRYLIEKEIRNNLLITTDFKKKEDILDYDEIMKRVKKSFEDNGDKNDLNPLD